MTGEKLKAACINAKHSVVGMDHFTPEYFSHLSDRTYKWLAKMLNTIEQGAPWPKDTAKAKAAFLSKDTKKTDQPLEYRILLILPTLYRRWAAARLGTMQQQVEEDSCNTKAGQNTK